MSKFQFNKKKYGLQKGPSAAGSRPFGAGGDSDDDDDDVAASLAREAALKKAKAEREQAERLVEEDPSLYDYDDALDKIHEQRRQEKETKRKNVPQKSKYIGKMKDLAKRREEERERVMERKIQREQEAEAHLYGDKETFVTRAYKDKLEERRKEEEEELNREKRDAEAGVAGKKDLSSFYYNLMNRNVATGATSEADAGDTPADKKIIDAEPSRESQEADRAGLPAPPPERGSAGQERRSQRGSEGVSERPVPKIESPLERAKRLNKRRNDDSMIEAARERYFQRMAAKAAQD